MKNIFTREISPFFLAVKCFKRLAEISKGRRIVSRCPPPMHAVFIHHIISLWFLQVWKCMGYEKTSPGDREFIYVMFVCFPPIFGAHNQKWQKVVEIVKFQIWWFFTTFCHFWLWAPNIGGKQTNIRVYNYRYPPPCPIFGEKEGGGICRAFFIFSCF